MPVPERYRADLVEGNIYHVYNRTNNRELLFKNDENRRFFLQRFIHYLSPYLDVYCWCLLPNHFHFLVRIKEGVQIKDYLNKQEILKPEEKIYLEGKSSSVILLKKAFQQFFTSYSMSFNKMHKRSGNLFHRTFKRLEVKKGSHFTQTVVYIHANPLKHKMVKDFTCYDWSSWKTILSTASTLLLRDELIDWFGSRELLIKTHFELAQYYYDNDTGIEE